MQRRGDKTRKEKLACVSNLVWPLTAVRSPTPTVQHTPVFKSQLTWRLEWYVLGLQMQRECKGDWQMQLEGRRRRIPAALFIQVGEGQQQQADVYDHSVGFRTHLLYTKRHSQRKKEILMSAFVFLGASGMRREVVARWTDDHICSLTYTDL